MALTCSNQGTKSGRQDRGKKHLKTRHGTRDCQNKTGSINTEAETKTQTWPRQKVNKHEDKSD